MECPFCRFTIGEEDIFCGNCGKAPPKKEVNLPCLRRIYEYNTISLQKASQNLSMIVNDTIENNEETAIVSDDGSVVMINQNEWENIKETLNLLNDEKALKALLDGHGDRQQNKPIIVKSSNTVCF